MENNKEEILIGSLYELVIKDRTEEEQDTEFMRIGGEMFAPAQS